MNRLKNIAILLVFFLYSCSSDCSPDKQTEGKLKAFLDSAMRGSQNEVIDMKRFTAFEWDSMFVASPYIPLDMYEQRGIDIKCLESTDILRRDDISVLVFLKDNKIRSYVEYPIWHHDKITDLKPLRIYSKEEAVFTITKASAKVN